MHIQDKRQLSLSLFGLVYGHSDNLVAVEAFCIPLGSKHWRNDGENLCPSQGKPGSLPMTGLSF